MGARPLVPGWCYGIHRPSRYPLHFPLSRLPAISFHQQIPCLARPIPEPIWIRPQRLIPLDGTPLPNIDVLLCFTFLVSDPLCSSTSPSVRWFPFLSHMLSSLDSAAAPHSLCSTSSSFHFPFHLSLLQSLVDTLSYDFSFSLYDSLFLFLLGPCTPLYSI